MIFFSTLAFTTQFSNKLSYKFSYSGSVFGLACNLSMPSFIMIVFNLPIGRDRMRGGGGQTDMSGKIL